jgi:hypothetical protein
MHRTDAAMAGTRCDQQVTVATATGIDSGGGTWAAWAPHIPPVLLTPVRPFQFYCPRAVDRVTSTTFAWMQHRNARPATTAFIGIGLLGIAVLRRRLTH